ncbi:hypothetical protein Tco_0314418, partial [Tanacetum coccineum]
VSTPVNAASAPRTFNDAGPSFVPLGRSFPLDVNDPLMPDLEDTAESYSHNLSKVYSTHPKAQIIGDPKLAVQTRGMTKKNSGEHAMISYIQKQRRKNHKDFQNCLFACFLSQHEPTKISQV